MATTPRYCPNCGAALQEGARTCPSCGTALAGGGSSFRWVLIALLALGALACIAVLVAAAVGGALVFGIRTRETQVAPSPVVAVTTVMQPTATDQPAATPTAVSALPTPNTRYEGLGFQLDPALGSGVDAETIAEVQPSSDVPPWEVAPQYWQVGINGYPLSGTFHKPEVLVYPVAEYEALSEEAAQIIGELRALLDAQPADPEAIPLLPFWNAAQVFRSNVRYMVFANGRGVRFLTQYGQGIAPINNEALFYTFQGLTEDGKYYVSVILPVNHPELPATGEMSQQEYEQLADNYMEYLDGVVPMLDAQPGASFTPSLEALDALVESIEIQP